MTSSPLGPSAALWNRKTIDLGSDEILAQLLDRGELDTWRELYRLAGEDPQLRARMARLVMTVPIAMPHFWLAALASLGEPIDYETELPRYDRDWV